MIKKKQNYLKTLSDFVKILTCFSFFLTISTFSRKSGTLPLRGLTQFVADVGVECGNNYQICSKAKIFS